MTAEAVLAIGLAVAMLLLVLPQLGFGLVVLATYHAIRKDATPRTRLRGTTAKRSEALYDAYTMAARSRRAR